VGDINLKTLEGVAGMFLSTLASCVAAVLIAAHQGQLVSAPLPAWFFVALLVALVTTMAETWSPRATDNFTIPLSACAVLFAFGLVVRS
jgi:dolichol kinase